VLLWSTSCRLPRSVPRPAGLFLALCSRFLLLVSIFVFLDIILGFSAEGFCPTLSELPSDLGSISSFLRDSPCDACPRLPPRAGSSSFLSLPFWRKKSSGGFLWRKKIVVDIFSFSFFPEDMTKLDALPWDPWGERDRLASASWFRIRLMLSPQSHSLSPKLKVPPTALYPVDPLGIRISLTLAWYLTEGHRRVACPHRVWSRIWRLCSSLRDGSTGMKWRLLRGEANISVRYKNTRLIAFYQYLEHGANVGSIERVDACVAEVQCPSVHKLRIPNVLIQEVRHVLQFRPGKVDAAAAHMMPDGLCVKRGKRI